MIALFAVAALLAVHSDQASPAATPIPAAQVIPEIGRTKSRVPACVALQELVAPSFAAAMRADRQFNDSAPQFAAYAAAKADSKTRPTGIIATPSNIKAGADQPLGADRPLTSRQAAPDLDSASPQMYLARLDKALAGMIKEAQAISNALGDPRLASDSTDPAVQSERLQLGELYAVQVGRISVLKEFLDRQRLNQITSDKNGSNAFDHASMQLPGATDTSTIGGRAAGSEIALDPAHVAQLFGQPMLNGLASNDKQSVGDWTNRIAKAVRDNENSAAQTFYGLAQNCMQ